MNFPILSAALAAVALQISVVALSAAEAAPDGKPAAARRPATRPMLNPDERLKVLTEKLALTPAQQEKVKAIYAANVEKLKGLREDKALTEEARRAKFAEMRKAEFQEIQAMLTPEQQEKMKALARERAVGVREQRPAAGK